MTSVETLAPLVGILARERTARYPDLYDDARQEGLVRAWTVLEKRPDAPASYVVAAVKRGINDVVRGRPSFGAASHRGRRDAHVGASALTRQGEDGEGYVHESEDPRARDVFDAVEVGQAVRDAVQGLAPEDRALVFGRYWEDLRFSDLAPLLGRPTGSLSRRWTDVIRPRLRADLAGLAT
jgi:RNA polymerase sigma factor (sigma-70 family)